MHNTCNNDTLQKIKQCTPHIIIKQCTPHIPNEFHVNSTRIPREFDEFHVNSMNSIFCFILFDFWVVVYRFQKSGFGVVLSAIIAPKTLVFESQGLGFLLYQIIQPKILVFENQNFGFLLYQIGFQLYQIWFSYSRLRVVYWMCRGVLDMSWTIGYVVVMLACNRIQNASRVWRTLGFVCWPMLVACTTWSGAGVMY